MYLERGASLRLGIVEEHVAKDLDSIPNRSTAGASGSTQPKRSCLSTGQERSAVYAGDQSMRQTKRCDHRITSSL